MSVVVGVGAGRGVAAAEVLALVRRVLAVAGVGSACLAAVATLDARAREPGIAAAAEALGVPLLAYDADTLAAVDVPTPSGAALAAVGTPSVAEAAALAAAPGGELLVPKTKSVPDGGGAARATVAVARRRGPAAGTNEEKAP
ncbi:cobalamin biosynthesis protein [Streptomyces sp. MI02-7b]|uniref:cobalamin biosynthesis protein n=1 Tax=Streptomyces sp. MI02-7b TaxID=462941 RepID=UPI0029B1BCE8|nr:cobalamin biosynthesis protein [Streptomyces sp. MI02-7b]MDX3074424.1 cobalamin biosynthesis protein [Streptomyces sp. MI02-7b]